MKRKGVESDQTWNSEEVMFSIVGGGGECHLGSCVLLLLFGEGLE